MPLPTVIFVTFEKHLYDVYTHYGYCTYQCDGQAATRILKVCVNVNVRDAYMYTCDNIRTSSTAPTQYKNSDMESND